MTLRDAHIAATRRLAADLHLRDHASRDAAALLLHALRLPLTTLHAHPGRLLNSSESAAVEVLLDRRLACEPMQYILGEQEFYGLALRVTPATLIPRPETELLVEAVLNRLPQSGELTLADVGTGSGAIAIALAHHLQHAHILALDLSVEALTVARENAVLHSVADRIGFRASDLLAAAPADQPFDAIVCNPPYIPDSDRATLHPEVRNHEPSAALFAGPDGLAIYRRLIPQAAEALKPDGILAMEFGYGQSQAIIQLLSRWKQLEILNDLQNIPRVILARKP